MDKSIVRITILDIRALVGDPVAVRVFDEVRLVEVKEDRPPGTAGVLNIISRVPRLYLFPYVYCFFLFLVVVVVVGVKIEHYGIGVLGRDTYTLCKATVRQFFFFHLVQTMRGQSCNVYVGVGWWLLDVRCSISVQLYMINRTGCSFSSPSALAEKLRILRHPWVVLVLWSC